MSGDQFLDPFRLSDRANEGDLRRLNNDGVGQADDSNDSDKDIDLLELTAHIVSAYVEKNRKHWDDVFRQLFR
jgi:hypothetical protein